MKAEKITEIDRGSPEKFWEWFSEVADELARNLDNPQILGQLDQRISVLKGGRLSWEVGPGKEKENMLVISPSGDEDLLLYTESLVQFAPVIVNWEFWPAKQPRKWNGKFEFQSEDGVNVSVESDRWEYVLVKFNDGTFDIVIKSVGMPPVAENDGILAAEIALDGYLGEKLRMQTIKEIDVVNEFKNGMIEKANRFPDLVKHLASIQKSENN